MSLPSPCALARAALGVLRLAPIFCLLPSCECIHVLPAPSWAAVPRSRASPLVTLPSSCPAWPLPVSALPWPCATRRHVSLPSLFGLSSVGLGLSAFFSSVDSVSLDCGVPGHLSHPAVSVPLAFALANGRSRRASSGRCPTGGRLVPRLLRSVRRHLFCGGHSFPSLLLSGVS